MNNLILRSITGAIFVGLILIPLFFEPIYGASIFGLFFLLGIIEFQNLFENSRLKLNKHTNLFFSIFIYAIVFGIFLDLIPIVLGLLIFPTVFLWFLIELWRGEKNPIENSAIALFGLIYVGLPFILATQLHSNITTGFPVLAGMFILIWSNDTFAYLSGRFFGKTKLFERISPKKTWEGTIGGVLLTIVAGFLIGSYLDSGSGLFWMGAALFIAPCAIFGDLLESLFKRSLNIKDSGNILPGHGGILDRFDASLFAIPFFYVYWYFWQII